MPWEMVSEESLPATPTPMLSNTPTPPDYKKVLVDKKNVIYAIAEAPDTRRMETAINKCSETFGDKSSTLAEDAAKIVDVANRPRNATRFIPAPCLD